MPLNIKKKEHKKEEAWRRIQQLQKELAEAPKYDSRSLAQIIGDMYDEDGLPR